MGASGWRTRRILKLLDGVTPENATEQRERLRQHGDALWQEFDSTFVEDHDLASGRVWCGRTVDAAQIFNERSLARRLIHSRLISATSGLLTALGVLGASLGCNQGISGLRFVNPQPGEMEASIQTLVNGLTIKFSSSIWGILCSIIFNVLEKLVEGAAWSRVRRVQERIDALFSRYTPETAFVAIADFIRGVGENSPRVGGGHRRADAAGASSSRTVHERGNRRGDAAGGRNANGCGEEDDD